MEIRVASRVARMVTVLAAGLTISLFSYASPIELRTSHRGVARDAARAQNPNHIVTIAPTIAQRRERLQKVMLSLDEIAQATLQLKPETASRLEPVVVDLAEQAIELTRDDSLNSGEADQSLLKLEKTVSQLVRTMNRFIEPELSL